MIYKTLMRVFAFVFASTLICSAGDPLLETLVSKGYLTSAEAKEIASSSSSDTVFTAKGKHTQKIRFRGRFHFQYDHLSSNTNDAVDPASASHFYFRRLYLGAKGELGNGWGGELVMDFAGNESKIKDAYVYWETNDTTRFRFGYTKVPFLLEDWTSSTKLKTIEHSVVKRFFADDIDFASRHAGLFLDGKFAKLKYEGSITNSLQGEGSKLGGSSNSNNDLMFAGRVSGKPFESLLIGANAAYQPGNTVLPAKVSGAAPDIFAWGGFAKYNHDKLELVGEFATTSVDDGKVRGGGSGDSDVFGYYVQGSYKVTSKLEPVIRWSHLDTDGMHFVDDDELIRRAAAVASDYDEISSIYAGINYLIQGNDVKLSAGYEYAEAEDRVGNAAAKNEISGFRTRLQLLF